MIRWRRVIATILCAVGVGLTLAMCINKTIFWATTCAVDWNLAALLLWWELGE